MPCHQGIKIPKIVGVYPNSPTLYFLRVSQLLGTELQASTLKLSIKHIITPIKNSTNHFRVLCFRIELICGHTRLFYSCSLEAYHFWFRKKKQPIECRTTYQSSGCADEKGGQNIFKAKNIAVHSTVRWRRRRRRAGQLVNRNFYWKQLRVALRHARMCTITTGRISLIWTIILPY